MTGTAWGSPFRRRVVVEDGARNGRGGGSAGHDDAGRHQAGRVVSPVEPVIRGGSGLSARPAWLRGRARSRGPGAWDTTPARHGEGGRDGRQEPGQAAYSAPPIAAARHEAGSAGWANP